MTISAIKKFAQGHTLSSHLKRLFNLKFFFSFNDFLAYIGSSCIYCFIALCNIDHFSLYTFINIQLTFFYLVCMFSKVYIFWYACIIFKLCKDFQSYLSTGPFYIYIGLQMFILSIFYNIAKY